MKYIKRCAYAALYSVAAYASLVLVGAGGVCLLASRKAANVASRAMREYTRNV